MKKPRIGIQGWFLDKPFTGIGQHTIGLTNALKKHAEIYIVTPKNLKPKWYLGPLKKWYWERVQAPAALSKRNLDLEYYPYPSPIPKYSNNRRAMTVHDLILWKDPRYVGNFVKTAYYKNALRALVNVDEIFTVSKSVYDELGIPSAKILPNGIPTIPKQSKLKRPRQARYPTKIHQQNKAQNLVYLGGYDIRKNVARLLHEFQILHTKFPEMKLILIGEPHHFSRYYPRLPEIQNVIKTGSISDKKVYELLKSAFAFVHFSEAEGFNIPLLQAMTVGCPAIVNDIPVNREVSGNSAIFLKASQKGSLTAKIIELQNSKKRAKIIKAEKEAAKKYSWEKSAKIFLKAIKKWN